jgi:phosphoribosylanthranilate isomerase
VITSLLESNSPTFKIYALTRNPTSRSAQSLSSKPNVELVQGDLDHPKEVFEQIAKKGGEDGKVWGVFSVQTSVGKGQSVEKEEKQGKVGGMICTFV